MKSIAVIVAAFFLLAASPKAYATTAEPATFSIGDVKVTVLQDMPGDMPVSILYRAPEAEIKKLAPSGAVPSGINVFLIRQEKRNILIDTGNGPGKDPLLPLLAQLGLTPDDITDILLTHMHGDHIGGLIEGEAPVYPKAKIQVSAPELYYWTENAAPGREATADKAKAVKKVYGDKLSTFEFGAEVLPGIQGLASVGHTPGHTMFLLSAKGKSLLFWGDLVHGAAIQFPMPEVCAKYDMNIAEAVDTRKTVMKLAADKNIPVAGAHLPFPAIGRVRHDGKAFKFVPGL